MLGMPSVIEHSALKNIELFTKAHLVVVSHYKSLHSTYQAIFTDAKISVEQVYRELCPY